MADELRTNRLEPLAAEYLTPRGGSVVRWVALFAFYRSKRPNTEYSEFPAEFIAAQKQQCGRQEERYCKTAQAMQQRLKKDSIRRLSKDETLGQASTTGTETHEFSTWSLAPFEAEESEEDRITVAGEEDDDDAYDADDADGDGADVAPKDKSHLLEGLSEGQQPLRDWLKGGYDIYVVTLQEVTSDNIFQAISFYLESENKEPFLRVDMGEGKISGYGKGAWTKMKSTSMACWIRESKLWPLGPVRPLAYKAFSFTVLNGSKGAITVVLKVHQQLVCFIGCHLPASHKERGKARAFIRSKIAAMYSYEKGVDFTRVFHHIFWAGDFNFRCLISSKKALDMLRAGKLQELQQYDERALEAGKEMEMHRWVEAPITFLPTYKKRDGRPPLDMSKPDWVEGEYQVTMKKKGMLGATKTVDRPPSWCDRITRWSRGELEFNVYSSSVEYFAATPSSRTILMASDHAPVGGGFSLYALDPKFTLPKTFMADPSEQFERAES